MPRLAPSEAPAALPVSCDPLRLLAAVIVGARAPVVADQFATIATRVPSDIVDGLTRYVTSPGPVATRAAQSDASGAWSGVLLPMQREAERLLPTIFDNIRDAIETPAGLCDLTITITVDVHDRLALWGASLDLVAHLIEMPDPTPILPLTALELGVPQEMAALVLDLYAADARRPSDPQQIISAA